MSTKRYGMMREVEYDFLDEITNKLKAEFGKIDFLEVGVCGGDTVRGMYRRGQQINCPTHCAGVDFEIYRPNPTPAPDYTFHCGDSLEMWRVVTGTFNLLLVDACHCSNHAAMDFLNYSQFVVVGGYALFHDTAPGVKLPGRPYFPWTQDEFNQDHSYSPSWAHPKDSILGVRRALYNLGLMQGYRSDWRMVREIPNNEGTLMGMVLFQKTKPLV